MSISAARPASSRTTSSANPPSFPEDSRFAKIEHLGLTVDIMAYIRDRVLKIPSIDLDQPIVDVATSPSGEENWKLSTGSSGGGENGSSSPQIGNLSIEDGQATVKIPKLKADFMMDIATRQAEQGQEAQLVVDAKGTYAGQPITGKFVGGAILSSATPRRPIPSISGSRTGPRTSRWSARCRTRWPSRAPMSSSSWQGPTWRSSIT